MNYPFLGYNTPGLQLGQPGWGNASGAAYQPLSASVPDMNFNGNYTGMGTNPTYQSVGESMGFQMPNATPASGFQSVSNWMSNNGDLLKAGLGLVTGGLGAWNGYQQNSLLRDQMNQQASQFREQMDLSKSNYNSRLEDRQRARVASNPTAYESVQDYMKKYGAK